MAGVELDKSTPHLCDPPWFVALAEGFPEPEGAAFRSGYDYWDLLGKGREPFMVHPGTLEDPGIPLGSLLIITLAKPGELKNQRIAETAVYHRKDDPQKCIVAARVLVDPNWLDEAGIDEVQSVARHEAGHLLGLKDDVRTPGSLMHYSSSAFDKHPISASAAEITEVERQYPIPQPPPTP